MVCVKELIAKLLTFVVMTGVGAIIFVIYALLAHYFETVVDVVFIVVVCYIAGWLATNIAKEIKTSRKDVAK